MPSIQSSASALQALQTKRSELNEKLVGIKTDIATRSYTLTAALNNIANPCAKYDTKITEHCSYGLERFATLQKTLGAVSNLPKNAVLREKGKGKTLRIVELGTRSATKRFFGIGSAKRAQQAVDLVTRLDLAGREKRNAITHADLAAAVNDVKKEIECRALKNVDEAVKESLEDLKSAARAAGSGYEVESMISAFEAGAVEITAIKSKDMKRADSTCEGPLTTTLRTLGAKMLKALDEEGRQNVRQLKGEIEQLDQEIGTLEQAEQIAKGNESVPAQKKSVSPETRVKNEAVLKVVDLTRQTLAKNMKELAELKQETQFSNLMHTNTGCRDIQGMLETGGGRVNGLKVVAEYERRKREDFTGGAILESAARELNSQSVKRIAELAYRVGRAEAALGKREWVVGYRRAQHSVAMIKKLEKMKGTSELLRPTRFMSTADEVKDTLDYPAWREEGLELVDFKITGFSAMKTGSDWRFNGEGQERLYTPHSCFVVTSVIHKDKMWHVELTEKPVNPDKQRITVPLTK